MSRKNKKTIPKRIKVKQNMTIEVKRSAPATPTDFSWQMGLGNCHAYLLHRTDMCEHIKLAA